MPDIVLRVDPKFMQRYAESYSEGALVTSRGDLLVESPDIILTYKQGAALEKIINKHGISVSVDENGVLKLIAD